MDLETLQKIAKIIPGFPHYFITNNGIVYSTLQSKRWKGIRKLSPGQSHYLVVRLWQPLEKRFYSCHVHRLVLLAWGDLTREEATLRGLEACHNDGDKSNNHISNLRWDTHSNNQKDMIRHGTARGVGVEGLKCHFSKLNPAKVRQIREYGLQGVPQRMIAREYGVWPNAIAAILNGKSWKSVK